MGFGSSEHVYHQQPLVNQSMMPNRNRRHSSYSHEDILNMKYQQNGIDPRYRDTRPFVNSSSNIYEYNARRDFFSRRRSSSSLQDDLIQPFKTFQLPKAPVEGILRKSNPTLTNSGGSLSDKSITSRWDLNPSIFIEEYDETKAAAEAAAAAAAALAATEENKSNASSVTNLSIGCAVTPSEDTNTTSFAGDVDEIPFIDDELVISSDHSEPIYIPAEMERHEYRPRSAVPKPPMIRNRKTVSFDLIERNDEQDCQPSSGWMNKSSTCGHITGVQFSKSAAPPSAAKPIFKFCSFSNNLNQATALTKSSAAPATNTYTNPTESFKYDSDNDNDSLSAYFCNDDDDDGINDQYRDYGTGTHQLMDQSTQPSQHPIYTIPRNPKTQPFDEHAVALDLSGLISSDSTTASSTPPLPPPLAVPEIAHLPHPDDAFDVLIKRERMRTAPPPPWMPLNFLDKLAFGHGKVQALRNYFETLKAPGDHRPTSNSFLTHSSPDLSRKPGQYTWEEQRSVMEQLREWSEHGTQSPIRQSTAPRKFTSVLNISEACAECPASISSTLGSSRFKSVPDITSCDYADEFPGEHHTHKKFPEAYIVRKSNGKTLSFPELYRKLSGTGYVPAGSPCLPTRYQTLRQIKHCQAIKRSAGYRGKGSGTASDLRDAFVYRAFGTEDGDEAR